MERKRHFRSNTCKIDLAVDKSEEVNTLLAVTNNPSAARRFKRKKSIAYTNKSLSDYRGISG